LTDKQRLYTLVQWNLDKTESCIYSTLNKTESCIYRTLNKTDSCINRILYIQIRFQCRKSGFILFQTQNWHQLKCWNQRKFCIDRYHCLYFSLLTFDNLVWTYHKSVHFLLTKMSRVGTQCVIVWFYYLI
jgi:hypothetical protein